MPRPLHRREKLQLRIAGAAVQELPANTPYTLRLEVRDFLGTAAATAYSFVRTDDPGGAAPRASLPGGPAQSFSPSKGLRVQALLDTETLCPGKNVSYSWTLDPPMPGVPSPYTSRDLVVGAATTLLASGFSSAYLATLTVSFAGSSASTSSRAQLTQALAPLVAKVSGTSGAVYPSQIISLSAAGSFDPDALNKQANLQYAWQCVREDAQPCFETTPAPVDLAAVNVSFQAALLSAADMHYSWRVTVTKGDRHASAHTSIAVITQPTAQGALVRRCRAGGLCPARHSTQEPLVLELDAAASVTIRSYRMGTANLAPSTNRSITIQPSQLPAAGDLEVEAVLVDTDPAKKLGLAQLQVQLNQPPVCIPPVDAATCIQVETISELRRAALQCPSRCCAGPCVLQPAQQPAERRSALTIPRAAAPWPLPQATSSPAAASPCLPTASLTTAAACASRSGAWTAPARRAARCPPGS